ncbi:MAG: OmpA family protein, partial [Candidatus Delongbacteria bacterium]|nr:OmpA family protein [Candidatus Delongbacteria bacterium]
GTVAYNKKLSEKRALAVKKRLSELGIPSATLKAVGYGPDLPIAPNDSEESRAKNRRVELVFQ